MSVTPIHSVQAGVPEAPAWSASWWLRLGQTVLFLGLLGVAVLLAAARGAHWAVYPISAVLLVAFIVGMLASSWWAPSF